LDEVEVVYSAHDPYVRLFLETAQRVLEPDDGLDLGVPVTFEEGVPARVTRPGRLLAAWLAWLADGFTQQGLLRMIQAHLLIVPPDDGAAVSARAVTGALRGLAIGFGRERFLPRIEGAIVAAERAAERDDDDGDDERAAERRARRARDRSSLQALRALTARLLEVSPPPAGEPRALVACALELVRTLGHCPGRLDHLARQVLGKEIAAMLEAIDTHDGALPPGLNVVEWLSELPRRTHVAGSGPRPGHLHVAGLRSGGHSGRSRTFIVGLDDGRFPPAGIQDPLVLDAERARIDATLPTSGSRIAEELEQFERLLARLHGTVVMSFSSRDVADGREAFASPVVLTAHRILSGRQDADYGDLAEHLGPPESFAPRGADACLDAGEWWMCQGVSDPPSAGLDAQMVARYPHLARGRRAEAERAGDGFTVYDGLVEEPAPDLDPRRSTQPVSASRLQTLGTCPLSYFYRHVLGIWPLDDIEVRPGEWLSALDYGTLLHEVLYDFGGELIAQKRWPPDPKIDAPVMAAVIEKRVARWRAKVPPPGREPFERQRRRLERAAEVFLNEGGGPQGEPRYLEAAIGLDPTGAGTALDVEQPVEVTLEGGPILVRGRLDRVDALSSGSYGIIDYKSGRYVKSYDPGDVFDQGRLLQHVLYMVVAEKALRERVAPDAEVDGFTFFFPDVSTHGRPVFYPRATVTEGLEVIDKLCAMAARGVFPATEDTDLDDCRYCDYRPACRSVTPDLRALCEGARRKCAENKTGVLKEFADLRRAGS
ncbi:MAG: PD-(D/E)XK nuclease family protein, partial [Planctomycetota bacterium]